MFDIDSRYHSLEDASHKTADGREIVYKRRRFLPQGEALPTLTSVTVIDGDRLDLIAARTLGNAERFWRVCDAENAMNPPELTRMPGRVLRVPVPQIGRGRCLERR